MRNHLLHGLLLSLVSLAGFGVARAADAEEPVLLRQSASVQYEVDGEDYLIIQDIEGTLSVRAAADGMLRIEGRDLSSQRELQDVALWRSDERTLILGPGTNVGEGTLVDMVLPASLDLEVLLQGGRLLISAIEGDLLVEAQDAKVQARSLKGDAEFVLTGGILSVDGVGGSLSFEGTDVNAGFQHLYADAELVVTKGKTKVESSTASVAIESTHSELQVDGVQGELRVVGDSGSLRVTGCEGGGDIQLEGAAAALFQTKGDFAIRTDAGLEFNMHEGPLNVLSYGAPIRGGQVAGPLVVENSNSTVELEQNAGSTEIRGSDLDVKVRDCKGPVTVHAVSSQISISGTQNPVVVENDYGDVRIDETIGSTTVSSRGGIVQVTNQRGPLELRADGPEVLAGWDKFTTVDAMKVHNETGDVRLELPATGRCQLQLKAAFGRIDSTIEGIRVADDGHTAGGEYTGGRGKAPAVKKPLIQASSGGGNIYVGTRAEAEEP